MTAEQIIALLGLEAHPLEGGWFRETWRAPAEVSREALGAPYPGARSVGTAIYYLLTPETFSELHRLPGVEVFHHYLGDPVSMLQIDLDGASRELRLGGDLAAGMRPQQVVPAGSWQGSRLEPGGHVALLGATMAPGFDYADYERGEREALLALCPSRADEIRALTR